MTSMGDGEVKKKVSNLPEIDAILLWVKNWIIRALKLRGVTSCCLL